MRYQSIGSYTSTLRTLLFFKPSTHIVDETVFKHRNRVRRFVIHFEIHLAFFQLAFVPFPYMSCVLKEKSAVKEYVAFLLSPLRLMYVGMLYVVGSTWPLFEPFVR